MAIPGPWARLNAYPLKRTFITSKSHSRNTQATPWRCLTWMWQVYVLQIEVLGDFLTSGREHFHLHPMLTANSAQSSSTSTLPRLLVSYTILSIYNLDSGKLKIPISKQLMIQENFQKDSLDRQTHRAMVITFQHDPAQQYHLERMLCQFPMGTWVKAYSCTLDRRKD